MGINEKISYEMSKIIYMLFSGSWDLVFVGIVPFLLIWLSFSYGNGIKKICLRIAV